MFSYSVRIVHVDLCPVYAVYPLNICDYMMNKIMNKYLKVYLVQSW